MTQVLRQRPTSQDSRGYVDNASALPTYPPPPHNQTERTFDLSYKADIFTRYRQGWRVCTTAAMQNILASAAAPDI